MTMLCTIQMHVQPDCGAATAPCHPCNCPLCLALREHRRADAHCLAQALLSWGLQVHGGNRMYNGTRTTVSYAHV